MPFAHSSVWPRILIVDDEPHVRKFLRLSLDAEKMQVFEAATAEQALTSLYADKPDLIVLDLGLPDLDGREVIRDVRQKTKDLPILVLTGRTEDSERIAVLDQGANDYMTKPFAASELIARIHAALASRPSPQQTYVTTGSLSIHLNAPKVMRGRRTVTMDAEEYALLRLLAVNGGHVLTYRDLESRMGADKAIEEQRRLLLKRISALRHKLEDEPAFPRYIVTESAVGYRLKIVPASPHSMRQ